MNDSKKKAIYKIYLVILLVTFFAGYMCGFVVNVPKVVDMNYLDTKFH